MTRETIRAGALAAVVVVAMVAMGAGLAGSVAGQSGETHTVGDGEDADFETISEALDSDDLSEGDTIEVQSGTYQELVEVDVDGVTITGIDDPLVSVPDEGADGGEPNIEVTGDDVTIEGLEVDINNPNGAATGGVILDGTDGTAVDNTVINSGDDVSGQGFIAGGGESLTIENNTLDDTIVAYWGDADADIRNNEFTGEVAEEAFWSQTSGELTVEGNDFSDVDTGAATVKFTEDSVTVNGETDDQAVAAAVGDSNTDVDTVTVAGETYDDNGNTVVSEDESIQQAIDDAEPGSTLVVSDGTYDEQLTIDKEISLVGGDGTPELSYDDGTVVQVRDEDVSVSGFEIVGSGTFDQGDLGIDVRDASDGASVDVTDTTFEDVYLGVQAGSDGRHSFTAENVTVTDSVSGFGHQSETGSAVVRDSTISVNSQGVGIYQGNNALVENNTITVDADEIDGEEPVYDVERGLDFSGSNVTVAENEIESTDTAILSESHDVSVEDVTVADNHIDAESAAVDDSAENVDLDALFAENDFERAAYLSEEGTVQSDVIYGSIGSAVDAAAEDDTVTVASGTYEEDVSVDTANVSVVGAGDDTEINGLVNLSAEDVTLANVAVEPDEFVRPDGEDGLPNDEKQAILVTASNASVYDSTIDVSLDANGAFEEVNAVQVFGEDDISDVQIGNNEITGTAENDTRAGVAGVSDQAETEETVVFNNSIDVDSEGYSFGVVTRASGGTNVEETPETVVVYNDIDATADAFPGVGYGIESTDEAQVDADAQQVKDNTFGDVDSIQHKGDDGTLDLTMNEWEDLENVSFLTDSFDDPAEDGGEIDYDPFLTSTPDPDDFTPPGERTAFGHDLTIPADGDTHSVAFPAPVEGTVSEVFGDFNGTVYAYDGDEWQEGSEIDDEPVGALDAFAVTVDEDADDQRIAFEYADSESNVSSMTTTELEAGWNFVGAPSSGPTDEAFAPSTAEVAAVSNVVGAPAAGSVPYGIASDPAANPTTVSPFQGYWVFATDDGELAAVVEVGPTQSNEEDALTGN